MNMVWDHAVILVETPGFMNPRMSERRITNMISSALADMLWVVTMERPDWAYQWALVQYSISEWANGVLVDILYFQPITDIRISDSRREAVELFQQLANVFMADDISVVTTMWNRISTRKKFEDADRRCNDLEKQIFSASYEVRSYNQISIARIRTNQRL
ncbi:hypothetical protein BJ165DRAFT_1404805 [Panaeolus papilionaceus]|nr:hypothetical protein BJ165DRAFT_1404805 [Panaeolus papilionaceus]